MVNRHRTGPLAPSRLTPYDRRLLGLHAVTYGVLCVAFGCRRATIRRSALAALIAASTVSAAPEMNFEYKANADRLTIHANGKIVAGDAAKFVN
jgi:hypothetical protein